MSLIQQQGKYFIRQFYQEYQMSKTEIMISRPMGSRLVKDLKEGQNSLCQSLINISQFMDIDQTFINKKNQFRISDKNQSLQNKSNKNSKRYLLQAKQDNIEMTPEQKIQIYRKEKIKEKYRLKFDQKVLRNGEQKRSFKLRKAKIPLMLNKFQQGLKKQVQLKFYKQLKKSQINLSFYRSQGKQSNQHSFQNPQNQQNLQNPQKSPSKLLKREKFFSLYSGKPENDEIMFPSFDLFVKGKNRAKIQQHYQMNINKIQKQLNTFYTQQNISESVPIPKKDMKYSRQRKLSISQQSMFQQIANKKQKSFFDQVQINKNSSKMFIVNQKNNQNKIQSSDDILRKSQISIQKSQKSSKQMIKTMTRFLKTKSESRRKYDNMVDFYHYDRPLTNRIRRSQYKLDNKNNSQLQDFRMHSQMQRQAYLKKNSQVYHKILNMLSNFHEDDIPISLQILFELRSFFINQYFLTQKNFQQILQKIKHETGFQNRSLIKNENGQFSKQTQLEEGQKIDFMIQKILEVINKFYGFQCKWYQ